VSEQHSLAKPPPDQRGGKHFSFAVLGQPGVHVDVLADTPQFLDLLSLTEPESMDMERRLQPGPVKLGHIHADLQSSAVHEYQACGKWRCHLFGLLGLARPM
jgi:hypothetical protein